MDADVYPWVARFAWAIRRAPRSKKTYVARESNKECIYLHHMVLPQKDGFDVSHIDGNGLNCTRENLCYRTRSETMIATYERLGDDYNIKRSTKPPKPKRQYQPLRWTIKKLADGSTKTYFYDKKTGRRVSPKDARKHFPKGFPEKTNLGIPEQNRT